MTTASQPCRFLTVPRGHRCRIVASVAQRRGDGSAISGSSRVWWRRQRVLERPTDSPWRSRRRWHEAGGNGARTTPDAARPPALGLSRGPHGRARRRPSPRRAAGAIGRAPDLGRGGAGRTRRTPATCGRSTCSGCGCRCARRSRCRGRVDGPAARLPRPHRRPGRRAARARSASSVAEAKRVQALARLVLLGAAAAADRAAGVPRPAVALRRCGWATGARVPRSPSPAAR